MKRKLFFLSVFLFISNLCYPFIFRELPLEETEAFRQKWVKVKNLEARPDQSLIAETEKKTCEVKAFFESMPVDFEASPFIYYTSEKYLYSLNLRKDSLNILFLSFTIDEEGLHGPAEVFINTDCLSDLEESSPCISLYFKDFCLKSDASVISGESLDDWSDIYLHEDYDFSFYKSTLEKKGDSYVVLGNLVLRYPFAYVNLGRLAFDTQCNLLPSEEYKQGLAPVSGGDGYAFQISSVRFDGGKIYGNGSIKVPGLNLIANYNAYEICFSPEEITAPLKGSGSSFKYRGYSLQGKRLLIYQNCKNDDIKIFSSSLLFQGRKMPLGDIFFHHDYYNENAYWRFVGGRSYDLVVQTKILCDDDIVDSCYFDAQGLRIRVLTKFPKANKKGQYYYFIAKADGSLIPYDNQTYYENRNFGFEDSELLSKDVTLLMEEEKFYISRATLAFPQNSCISELYFDDLYLNFDGRVEQYEIPFCSLQICGMGFILDKASFFDDGIIFSGTLYLPEALPGIFSGSRMTVEKFYIGFDGMVKELVAHREGSTSFYVSDYIIASTKGSHLEIEQMKNPDGSLEPAKLYLCMDNSGIVLPRGYYLEESSLPVENLRCDLTDYKGFDLSHSIFTAGYELGLKGMTLAVEDLCFVPGLSTRQSSDNYQENGFFQFKGKLTLSDSEESPEFFRGLEIPALLGIDMKACLCKVEAEIDLDGGSLSSSRQSFPALALGSLKAHLEPSLLNERSLALVADSSSFVLGGGMPDLLLGRELRGEALVYDFDAASYLLLSGSQSGIELPSFTPEMRDLTLSVDYSYENPEDGVISLCGELASPEAVSFAGEAPQTRKVTGTMLFDMSGNIKDFTERYEY